VDPMIQGMLQTGFCDMPVAAWRMNGSISRRCGVAAQGAFEAEVGAD
jgi:hypothetical protein